MPKKMVTLNDFSGGLNTKFSPRDIAGNEAEKSDNVVLFNSGLIKAASNPVDKVGSAISSNQDQEGNGLFIFNTQYDIGRTTSDTAAISASISNLETYQVDHQVLAYPDGVNIKFYSRNFANTGDFSHEGADNQIATGGDTNVQPVYYYVDGVLYVSDKKVVDGDASSNPKCLQFINAKRFTKFISQWVVDTAAVTTTDNDVFNTINTSGSLATPADAGDFMLAFKTTPGYSNTTAVSSGTLTAKVGIKDTVINVTSTTNFSVSGIYFLNGEAMEVSSLDASNDTLNVIRNVYGDAPPGVGTAGIRGLEHESGDAFVVLGESGGEPDDDIITSGGWPEGQYEFTHTLGNQTGDESLPWTIEGTTANIVAGNYFTDVNVRINIEGEFRKREKGFRIYTRKKGSNDRFILLLDADYDLGIRRNLFEDYTAWALGSGDVYGSGVNLDYAEGSSTLTINNPSLDTYESINGYSQEEQSISLGDDGGYKAATICSRRAWISNVRKENKVYDDRIYYSPVNKFATFPDSYYLDIGINDGDAFTALHSFGNRVLAFKQKKLYVINVSSTSDAGWYLEGEYNGMGCLQQESLTKTPLGICWVNEDGVFIYSGEGVPVELTQKLDDATWRTNQSAKNPAIGYNNKYKQLCVVQDTSATNDILIFDFITKSWSITKGMSNGMSNFVESFDGLYYNEYASSGHDKTLKLFSGDANSGTAADNLQITLQTKDIDFGNPGKIKKVYKVYVTAKDDGSGNSLTLTFGINGTTPGTTAYNSSGSQAAESIGSSSYKTLVYSIGSANGGTDCESIQFKFQDADNEAITINDITIEYREKYKRAS